MRKIILLSAHIVLLIAHINTTAQFIEKNSPEKLTITDATVINEYLPVVDITQEGCRSVLHIDPSFPTSKFRPGDKVLIIQMQGALIDTTNTTAYGTLLDVSSAGNLELSTVYSVGTNRITLISYLLSPFSVIGKVQVIKIPIYNNAKFTTKLSCPKWDGLVGGVLAVIADSLVLEADIDVSGKGFRGGVAQSASTVPFYQVPDHKSVINPSSCARKGEGIAGFGIEPYVSGRGAPANGGGGGNNHNAGGGGGANVGCGGKGGWAYNSNGLYSGDKKVAQGSGGHSLPLLGTKVFMGGGGGAGHGNTNQQSQVPSSDGGAGGGIVILIANYLQSTNCIIMTNGSTAASTEADGAGGGGAGGSILLAVQSYLGTIHAQAVGGHGGNVTTSGVGPGGGGGGGLIYFQTAHQPSSVQTNISSGTSGRSRGEPYGSSNGCEGSITFNLKIPENHTSSFDIFAFPDTVICPGEVITLGVRSSHHNGNFTYRWEPTDEIDDPLSPTPTVRPTRNASYIVTVANNQGCTVSDTVTIFVSDYPSQITVQLPDTIVTPGIRNISLPIIGLLPNTSEFHNFFTSVFLTVAYEAHTFDITGISSGIITHKETRGKTHRISILIPLHQDSIRNSALTLTHLIGNVLFSAKGETPFTVDSLAYMPSEHCSEIGYINGNLHTTGYCFGYDLRKFTLPHITLYPSPATEAVTVHISEALHLPISLEIVNTLGLTIAHYNQDMFNTNSIESSISLTLDSLSNGLYFLRFIFPQEIRVIPLIKAQ